MKLNLSFLKTVKNPIEKIDLHKTPLYVLVISVFIIFSLVAGITCLSLVSSEHKLENAKLHQLQLIGQFNLETSLTKALARAEIIASLPRVRELFAAGKRDQLEAELKEMYEIQAEKFGVDQAQFHTLPATSFLRLNHPAKFGDDLSFRPIITQAQAEQIPLKGISITRSGPTLVGIAPMRAPNGNYVGSFEFGQSFEMLIDTLKSAYGIESAVFFDEELLKKMATNANPAMFSEKNRYGNYIKTNSTNWEEISEIIKPDEINSRKEVAPFTRDLDGKHHGIVVITLKNVAGAKMGSLVLLNDLSVNQHVTYTLCILVCLISLFGAVLISGILVVVIKGGILSPLADLSKNFRNLADDPQKSKSLNPANFRGAVQSLADSYRKLRAEKHLPDDSEKTED